MSNSNDNTATSTASSDAGTNEYLKIIGWTSLITLVVGALMALITLIAFACTGKKNKKEDNEITFDKDAKDVKMNIVDNNLDEIKKKNEVTL